MKKIIYIIDNLNIGGAQKHLLRLTQGLDKEGYSVEIVCLGNIEESISRDIKIPIRIFKMDCVWELSFWKSFFALKRLLTDRKPTIVHTYLNTSNVFGIL